MRRLTLIAVAAVLAVVGQALLGSGPAAMATSNCTFTISGASMQLNADCTTDATIGIPGGFILDGNNHTITAVDPPGGHFLGAVITNLGTSASVRGLTIFAGGLANVCDAGGNRLRAIMFEGASGIISHNTVLALNQGASGCQEGNAIEVRNAPFDGSHPDTHVVEIVHNVLTDWQKTGIVANGDVMVNVHHNRVGASATQDNLAANGIQLGFGALGSVKHNQVDGNQWKGTSFFAASAVLVFDADVVDVSQNNIMGNSDVGLFVVADNGTYDNNKVFDEGADHVNSCCDIGVGDFGDDNLVTNNKVRGFDPPYDGLDLPLRGRNKSIPGPQAFGRQ